jgi:opacity protein-like surface antigen
MKKLMLALVVAALASASFAADGVVTPSLKEGTQEIVADGFYDPSSMEGDVFSIGMSYGYFVMDNVEVGVGAAYQDADKLGSSVELGAFGEYNFDLGTPLVPFVGVGVSYTYLDYEEVDTDDSIVGTGSAGVKYFLADNIALRLAANASIASEDVYSDEDGDVTDEDFNITLGMAFYIP